MKRRRARVYGVPLSSVASYLPSGYAVIAESVDADGSPYVLIDGHDDAGWTLSDYVIPRLASGLYHCVEIEVDSRSEAGRVTTMESPESTQEQETPEVETDASGQQHGDGDNAAGDIVHGDKIEATEPPAAPEDSDDDAA